MKKPLTYADAGVDIDKADRLVGVVKKIAEKTHIPGVLGGIGGFGGLFAPDLSGMKEPVLVSSTDGVGTKLKIAFMTGRHDTVGIDLVAMCVNDIAVSGARPLFFLDYISMGKLESGAAADIVRGVAAGCRMAGCALLGGETAEMPGMYAKGEYDLAGFAVGVIDRGNVIDGSGVEKGDAIIGVASSGLHSNGYSLARKICFETLGLNIDSHAPELGTSIGEALLTPTKIYAKTISALVRDFPVRGIAHITGGGISDNIIRSVPETLRVSVRRKSWDVPRIFSFLKEAGNVPEKEMARTFNNGLGLAVIAPEKAAADILRRLEDMGETGFVIGEITERTPSGDRFEWTD
ncbi:phosphoribosylaminoimidazole synthetase [Candidatus Desulfarcum epimagneticum]|uniref:Phosphoribosylformylglycinamidine cyclo-ligase n=1 Tax=uncultured Desulfobacteraceae bacterium TaxID=218296 RepID=A0A484HLS4_9BACT|nr:phosphoribosylaminoimidazole synthetase [uncultured Desulfobacteraceae bacterium]